MSYHCKQVLRLVKGNRDCCDMFPLCNHSTWEAVCPECGKSVSSDSFLGVYSCECGLDFSVLVDGWVDATDENKEN